MCFVASGCAYSYETIEPASYSYHTEIDDDPLTFSYRANALDLSDNRRYAKKARKKDTHPVVVQVTNRGEQPITLSKGSIAVRAGQIDLPFVEPEHAGETLEQNYWWHLLWLPVNGYYQSPDGNVTTIPIGLFIGAFNIIRGANANSKMKSDFREKYLIGQTVGPGETVRGLVFLIGGQGEPLTFEYTSDMLGDQPAAAKAEPEK